MEPVISIERLLELINLYKYASIEGEKTELIIAPLFVNGKYDEVKRVITIGLQGGFSRDRESFIIDSKDFDSDILPFLINYYENDDKLEMTYSNVATLDNQTSKAIYETETGDLLYLETLDKNLFATVNEKKENYIGKQARGQKTKEEKDWEEMLSYAKKRRTTTNFYKEIFKDPEEINILEEMIGVLSNEKKVNISNSNRAIKNNIGFIEEYLEKSNINDELKKKIRNKANIRKLATVLGAEARIKTKLDLNDEAVKSKLIYVRDVLSETEYFDMRFSKKFADSPEDKKSYGRNKQTEALRLKEELLSRGDNKNAKFCDELIEHLEVKSRKISSTTNIKKIEDAKFEAHSEVIVDNYEELLDAVQLVLGARVNREHFEFIIKKNEHNQREVRLSITNGISRTDDFNFLFNNGDTFDLILKDFVKYMNVTDKPVIINVDRDFDKAIESSTNNQILFKGYGKDFSIDEVYGEEKAPQKQIIRKINGTSFKELNNYYNKFKVKANENNKTEIFYKKTNEQYYPSTDREQWDIEFATYWGIMLGIFDENPENKKINMYAERIFSEINDFFTLAIIDERHLEYEEVKEFVINALDKYNVLNPTGVFERFMPSPLFLDYFTNYYNNIIEEEEYEFDNLENTVDDFEDDMAKLFGLNKEIIEQPVIEEDALSSPSDEDVLNKLYQQMTSAVAVIEEEYLKNKQQKAGRGLSDEQLEEAGLKAAIAILGAKTGEDIYFQQAGSEMADKIFYREKAEESVRKEAERQEVIREAGEKVAIAIVGAQAGEDIYFQQAGSDTAEKIIYKEAGEESAHNIFFEEIGEVQASELLKGKIKDLRDTLIAIIDDKHKNMEDAFEVSNSYATKENPSNIKVFYSGDNEIEVIIGNGTVDETVIYQETFSKNEEKELIDKLIDLYLNNNEKTKVSNFQVPNTNKGYLIALGEDQNVFQVSNPPKEVADRIKERLEALKDEKILVNKR